MWTLPGWDLNRALAVLESTHLPERGARLRRGSEEGVWVPCIPVSALALEEQDLYQYFPYFHMIPRRSLLHFLHMVGQKSLLSWLKKASVPGLHPHGSWPFDPVFHDCFNTSWERSSFWRLPVLSTLQSRIQVWTEPSCLKPVHSVLFLSNGIFCYYHICVCCRKAHTP